MPIIFYHPTEDLIGVSQKVAQHIDIMPTVLAYLNYDKPYFAFGKDLLSDESDDYAISYTSSTYQFVNGDMLLYFNGQNIIGAYSYKTDSLLKNNFVDQNDFAGSKHEQLLKGIIQQYHNRMIDDKLIPEK